jgi:hypothetical protein
MNRNFKPLFSMTGAISQDRERCQFLFLLDEKPTVVPVGSAGEQSGGAQEVPYGAVRSKFRWLCTLQDFTHEHSGTPV